MNPDPLIDGVQRLAVQFLAVVVGLVVALYVGQWFLRLMVRWVRPKPADGYCCVCSGRACGWGCCHRSCIDHDPRPDPPPDLLDGDGWPDDDPPPPYPACDDGEPRGSCGRACGDGRCGLFAGHAGRCMPWPSRRAL